MSRTFTNYSGFSLTLKDMAVDCIPNSCLDSEDLDSMTWHNIHDKCWNLALECSQTYTCESTSST